MYSQSFFFVREDFITGRKKGSEWLFWDLFNYFIQWDIKAAGTYGAEGKDKKAITFVLWYRKREKAREE